MALRVRNLRIVLTLVKCVIWQSMAPNFTKGVFHMKVVYPTCCGVDIHKTFLVATIIKTTKALQPSYQKKTILYLQQ